MQNQVTTSPPSPVKLSLKLAAAPDRTIENANAYAPELRVGHCVRCACDVLRIELRQREGLFAQTNEPLCRWIKIGIPLAEFFSLTGISHVHACDRPEVLQ